jgi:hypothetical protein
MYQDTITLFNRKKKSDSDVWYPTIIRNVNLNIDKAAILAKYGSESQDKAMLSIRYKTDGQDVFIAGKPWMSPKTWDGTEDAVTFNPDGDFFWKGEWKEGIVSDDLYTDGFYSYMNKTHDYIFAVSSVAQYSVIPHFEIMGK